ncbi:valine--tRNA ligase [Candidatus Saccharibacteria bacterium]|nr:valine--tRNA ligase [Candidatus Saccharibacteria bacterium]
MKFSKTYEPNQFEPDIYALWESSGAFRPAEQGNPYSIVLPPPNANGNLHIGHGLTVAVEDSLIRYHRLVGDSTWFLPGADHAGFETWVVFEKYLESQGDSRFNHSREELYQMTWDFVAEQRGNMELQLRALGASLDWSAFTFTLDPKVIDTAYTTFKQMWDDNLVYRGEKTVNFCPKHQTAFADIEVAHKEEQGTLYDIAYPLADGHGELVVSTTRPETMFGDTAVAVDPDDKRYQNIIGKYVKLPLTDREIPVIADDFVDEAFGTGVVKVTPAHDHIDFEVGKRHNLPMISVIGEDGKLTEAAGADYAALTIEQAREKVLKDLKAQDLLRGRKEITHSVAHCYKCNSILEPLLKEQWFVKTEPLAAKAIEALRENQIKFYPASKKQVVINYFKQLKDWNISRQIPWGIPIPAFKANDGQWIFDTNTDQPFIIKDGVTYYRDEDTFDTWFSSGQWPYITTNHLEQPSPYYPLAVMETAADILFAWVARMIMFGLYRTGTVPFKDVYLHGLVLDEKGQKMSKSKGNVINPIEIIGKYGSDAFRIGILSSRSAGLPQAFSESKVVAGRNLCNKLWNISRFIQQMVDEGDFKEAVEEGRAAPLLPAEREGRSPVKTGASPEVSSEKSPFTTINMGEDWICRELDHCKTELDKLIGKYRFAEAVELLYDTIWNKYADWFLESQKIYKNTPLLQKTLEHILIMLHPFAPFLTETIWQTLSWTTDLLITQKWPAKLPYDPMTAEQFETLMIIISTVRGHLQSLPGGQKPNLLFGNDSLVNDNQVLIQFLTHVPAVIPDDTPQGMRIALPNREIYLDIDEQTLKEYKQNLENNILKLGAEINTLETRLRNPNYRDKAPKELVEETQKHLEQKQTTMQRLKNELTLI